MIRTTIEPLEARTLMAYAGQVVGYYSNHSATNLAKIDLSALTQLNYAFVNANSDGSLIASSYTPSLLSAAVTAAHAQGVKVNITVDPGAPYTTIMASSSAISTFTSQLVSMCSTYKLDGIDLDWEAFPPTSAQVTQYGAMLTTMHNATAAAGLKLSAAVVCSAQQVPSNAFASLDYYNVMCYDINYNDTAPYASSIQYLNNWASYGVPKSKLIMGVPFYGRAGTSWSDTSTMLYSTIASNYQTQYGTALPSNLDKATLNGTTWGFNGVDTIKKKASYVVSNGFGGMMVWELTEDHFTSTSTYDSVSLLPVIKSAMTVPFATLANGVLTVDQSLAGKHGVFLSTLGTTLTAGTLGQSYGFSPLSNITNIIYKGTSAADSLEIDSGVTQPVSYIGNGVGDALLIAGNYSAANNLGANASNLAVTVAAGYTLSLSGQQTLGSLASNGTTILAAGAATVLNLSALSIGSTGKLDLNDDALVIDYSGASPATAIQSLLKTGYASGKWSGLGIDSSVAAATAGTTLGWAEASSLYSTFPATFAGQSVDSTSILVRYTYSGDVNLDGTVDIADLGTLASNWQGSPRTFSQGDTNYDNIVDIADLGVLASNWQKTMASVKLPLPTAIKVRVKSFARV